MEYFDILGSQEKEKNEIRIVIVSNIKGDLSKLHHLCRHFKKKGAYPIDLVLILGNTNTPKSSPEEKKGPRDKSDRKESKTVVRETQENLANAEGQMSCICDFLENLFGKIVYIGGMSDPESLFEDSPILSLESENITKGEILELIKDENLYALGMGGTVDKGINHKMKANLYSSVYYLDNLICGIQKINLLEKEETPNSTILMTYLSPSILFDKNNTDKIFSSEKRKATECLSDFIEKYDGIMLSVSGDEGLGPAYRKYYRNNCKHKGEGNSVCYLIHPGELSKGNFVILTLRRGGFPRQWRVNDIEFVYL